MEALAIGLLFAILVIGAAIFFTGGKFLGMAEENRRMHSQLLAELRELQKRVDSLASCHKPDSLSGPADQSKP